MPETIRRLVNGGHAMTARANDVQTLEELNRDYVRAGQTSDTGWFDKHLAACFMASNPDGSLEDRGGFLTRIGRPNPSKNMAPVDTRVRVVGDVGVVDSGFQYTKPDGQDGVGHYTDVYGFIEGRWQCVSAHFALRPAPPQTGGAKTADVVSGAPNAVGHEALGDLNQDYGRAVRASDVG